MSKIIPFVMFLLLSAPSFSQSTTPVPLKREDYLKKSKSQKAGAWMLLGGGTAVLAITAISAAGNITIGSKTKRSYDAPLTIGAAMMIASVPLFIAAGKNKRKGMAITFRNTPILQIRNSSLVYQPMAAVSLKISL